MLGLSTPVPGRYPVEIALMERMHWSWEDLCNAPSDLVAELTVRHRAEMYWSEQRRKRDDARNR